MLRILLLGSGGREHALAWKISQSPKVERLYIAPGNAGTAEVGENVNIKADDFDTIKMFVQRNRIQMVVVGPEDPLVKGIYDYFKNDVELKDIPVIFLTGLADRDRVINMLVELKPQGYILKPAKKSELVARIIDVLG